ncbi:hypothetical protein Ga0080574_TMP4154 [Salipiger abyssi]|uniref:Uncharacterized protein n=1 Tax=Salipiger abyssi TaxID=1250539 RepID=A0A1P8UYL4_9RHOB|nr:hypothetical protein Ga0080574_TMP4154 [Salipiger abyssi]
MSSGYCHGLRPALLSWPLRVSIPDYITKPSRSSKGKAGR